MTPGKKALITGGSSPLAVELGSKLFEMGYAVFLTSRSLKYLRPAQKLFPCSIFAADIATSTGKEIILSWIFKEAPDLLINSAGLGFYGDTLDLEDTDIVEMCEVNMIALTLFSKAAAQSMRHGKKEGIIVNISSATDALIYPCFAVYAASKSYVTSFSRALAYEVLPFNISVLVASPGQLQTRFQQRASKGYYAEHQGLTAQKAAQEILKMIEKKQSYHVFPIKTKILRKLLNLLLPQKILFYLLKKSLKKRIETR
jgi:short-subunit dehydrogenase